MISMRPEDDRARGGMLAAEAARSFRAADSRAPPTFVITEEQYDRIARSVEKKPPVRLQLSLKATASDWDVNGANVVAETPGSSKPTK